MSSFLSGIKDVTLYIPRLFGYFKNEKLDIQSLIDDHMDSFDIMLCHESDFWFSEVVELATWSSFSHVGIVLKSPTWLDPGLTGTYLLQSGAEPFPDAVDGKMKFGVQISEMNEFISTYTGHLYFRKLNSIPVKQNPEYYYDKVVQLYSIIDNKTYDDSPYDLIRAQLHLRLGDCQRTNSFFCSALCSFFYTQLGFLPADTQWDLVKPKDFAPGYGIDKIMAGVGLASFGPINKII